MSINISTQSFESRPKTDHETTALNGIKKKKKLQKFVFELAKKKKKKQQQSQSQTIVINGAKDKAGGLF